MTDTRSDNAKSNLKKLAVAVLVAIAGAGGADAAGYTIDGELAKQLGIGGGLILVVYLHLVFRPLLAAGVADVAWIRRKLEGAPAPAMSVVDADAAAGVGPDPQLDDVLVTPTAARSARPTPVPLVAVRAPTNGSE